MNYLKGFLGILEYYIICILFTFILCDDYSIIKDIIYSPETPEVGKPFCFQAIYNLEDGDSLSMVIVKDRRYWYMNRDLDFDERVIYYYESPDCMDTPQYYNHFPRLSTNLSSPEKFCFKMIYPEDDGSRFQWIAYNKEKVASTKDFQLNIKFSEHPETQVTAVLFDPPAPVLGDPFCMTAEYKLHPEASLYSLHLQVHDDPPILVYSFRDRENKLYYEHPNHWSIRHDPRRTRRNTFCFKHLEIFDEEIIFEWVLVDSLNHRSAFAFNFELIYKERSETEITGIGFDPDIPELGYPFCMTTSYTFPSDVSLYTLHFRVEDQESIPLYWNQNPNHEWRNKFIYLHNNSLWLKEIFLENPGWNERIDRNTTVGSKLCFKTVLPDDALKEFQWVLVDSEFYATKVNVIIKGVEPWPSKIYSAAPTFTILRVGEAACVLVKYSVSRRAKSHRLQTRISLLSKFSDDDDSSSNETIITKTFLTKPIEKRTGNGKMIERKLCYPGKVFISEEYLYRFDLTLLNKDKPVSNYSLQTFVVSGDTPEMIWQDNSQEYGPGYIVNIVCYMEDVEGPKPTMTFYMDGKEFPEMYMSPTEIELMKDEVHYTLQKRLTYTLSEEVYNSHDNFYKPILINCQAKSGKEVKMNAVHVKLKPKINNPYII